MHLRVRFRYVSCIYFTSYMKMYLKALLGSTNIYSSNPANGGYGLGVDHVSDIIRLPEYDERVPAAWRPDPSELPLSADSWKVKGNDHFQRHKYYHAIDW